MAGGIPVVTGLDKTCGHWFLVQFLCNTAFLRLFPPCFPSFLHSQPSRNESIADEPPVNSRSTEGPDASHVESYLFFFFLRTGLLDTVYQLLIVFSSLSLFLSSSICQVSPNY